MRLLIHQLPADRGRERDYRDRVRERGSEGESEGARDSASERASKGESERARREKERKREDRQTKHTMHIHSFRD